MAKIHVNKLVGAVDLPLLYAVVPPAESHNKW